MKWYVLYCKPKAEKKVAENLVKLGFQSYCPLITETHQWSDRKKKVKLPLLPSYVFVRLQEKNRNKVFEIPGVVRYLYWLGRPATVRNNELEVIRSWMSRDKVVEIRIEDLSPLDRVILLSGALLKEEPIVKEMGPKRFRLILMKLGISICAETKEVPKKMSGTPPETFN